MSKKQLIVAADVQAVAKTGGKLIHLQDPHAIVTAEARSLAKELGVEIKLVAAGDVARRGLWEFLAFLSALNLHLGLVNLLPFPALDGGRLIFVAFELVFRRRIPERYEGMIHYLGFAFLMALMVWITWRDVQRIVFGLR